MKPGRIGQRGPSPLMIWKVNPREPVFIYGEISWFKSNLYLPQSTPPSTNPDPPAGAQLWWGRVSGSRSHSSTSSLMPHPRPVLDERTSLTRFGILDPPPVSKPPGACEPRFPSTDNAPPCRALVRIGWHLFQHPTVIKLMLLGVRALRSNPCSTIY